MVDILLWEALILSKLWQGVAQKNNFGQKKISRHFSENTQIFEKYPGGPPVVPRGSPGVLFQISKVQTKRMNMVSKSFKWCMYYIFSSNFIIESLKHKLNCCFGRYINSYWIAHCECDEHLTILNHFKRVFLTHIVAPDWGKLHTFKNSAFILPLSHIEISVYAELGARVYEVFYEILSICQKSTPGVPRGTFSKSGYSIKNMAYKAAPSSTVVNVFWKHWNYSTFIFFLVQSNFHFIRRTRGPIFILDFIDKRHTEG